MSSTTKTRLLESREKREGFLRAKLNHLIPSQIRSLRIQRRWTQKELAEKSEMKQARISAMEKPGNVNFSLETLIRLAAAYRVALQVRFVPYSELADWERDYSQDSFTVAPIEADQKFLSPAVPRPYTQFEFTPPVATGIVVSQSIARQQVISQLLATSSERNYA